MSLVRLRAIWITNQCFDAVGWVIWPVKHRLGNDLNCVERDVKPCSTNQWSGGRCLRWTHQTSVTASTCWHSYRRPPSHTSCPELHWHHLLNHTRLPHQHTPPVTTQLLLSRLMVSLTSSLCVGQLRVVKKLGTRSCDFRTDSCEFPTDAMWTLNISILTINFQPQICFFLQEKFSTRKFFNRGFSCPPAITPLMWAPGCMKPFDTA